MRAAARADVALGVLWQESCLLSRKLAVLGDNAIPLPCGGLLFYRGMLLFRGRRFLWASGRCLCRGSGFVFASAGNLIGGFLLFDEILALERKDDLSGNSHADRHATAGWRLWVRCGRGCIGLRRSHAGCLGKRCAAYQRDKHATQRRTHGRPGLYRNQRFHPTTHTILLIDVASTNPTHLLDRLVARSGPGEGSDAADRWRWRKEPSANTGGAIATTQAGRSTRVRVETAPAAKFREIVAPAF